MAENPNTWGKAEKVIMEAIAEADLMMKEGACGYSLPRRIALALKDAGLLVDEGDYDRRKHQDR